MSSISICLCSFSLVTLFLFSNSVQSFELCESYISNSTTIIPDRNCSQEQNLCCGGCDFKYCCNDTSSRLDQSLCKKNLVTENQSCQPYEFIHLGQSIKVEAFKCPQNSFCCGNCDNRSCCNNSTLILNQNICRNVAICESYRDVSYNYINAKICIKNSFESQFCCGSCYNRFCCNDENLSFNQTNCLPMTTLSPTQISPKKRENKPSVDRSLVYSLIALGIFIGCMIILGVPICVIAYNYRKRVNNLNRQNQLQMTNIAVIGNNSEVDKPPEYNELDKSISSEPPGYPGVPSVE